LVENWGYKKVAVSADNRFQQATNHCSRRQSRGASRGVSRGVLAGTCRTAQWLRDGSIEPYHHCQLTNDVGVCNLQCQSSVSGGTALHSSFYSSREPALKMSEHSSELYQFEDLPTQTSFRIVELLPGKDNEPISCLLQKVDWAYPPEYEAVSYAWGDPNAKAPVICHGKILEVSQNLHSGLTHLRFPDRSRMLWVDCLW
jgi:hypothetical protein